MPKREDISKIMVIGSGPIIIGQAAEFDYSGSQACKALREEGYEVVLVNSNPATIQTDKEIADIIYVEPLVPEVVARIIERERPDGVLPTMGGQTGLNLVTQLAELGILEKYGVETLGTSIESIKRAEDRELFAELMREINEPIPESKAVRSVEDALETAEAIGYPVIIRPAYTLGGTGGGVANNEEELKEIASRGLKASLVNQVLIEKSLLGWYEYEYEVMRDGIDNCITVCNMENIDPMGIHTGESIVVAPAQTLSDVDHQKLRSAALKIIRALKIEGGCNIQFAVHPERWEYYVIEVNPRVSRSSALASKATGYPIAKIAAKIAIGLTLDEIPNDVTKETPASFEPSLDYVVVKIPRWPFDKFREADKIIGTQMKSTGEVMAIGRTFEEALQKAIRSLDIGRHGICADGREEEKDIKKIVKELKHPTDKRIFYIYDALKAGLSIEEINKITGISPFFLYKIKNILDMENKLLSVKPTKSVLQKAKKLGFSDKQLAYIFKTSEEKIRKIRKAPAYKMVDTCAAEFEAKTPYYYSSYESVDEVKVSKRKKIIIVGAGPIRIGQGIEFDYCCVHGVLALREEGIEAIIINNNPETVSTDYDVSDKLYFEPLTFEDVMNVIEKEKPYGVIVQFGGQTSINLAVPLAKAGVKILGTSPENIDRAEDRERFTRVLKKLGIPQAPYGTAFSFEEAKEIASRIGYPVLVRPSYVLGGRAMDIVYDEASLQRYISEAVKVSGEHPILIDKFLDNAIEIDVDAVADGKEVFIGGIMEHIEHAGVHSGDSACVLPPQTLSRRTIETIKDYTRKIARELNVIGLLNIQLAVKNGKVYVLEVNPRASRTVPFVSKAIGIPLAKLATKVILGKSLKELGYVGEAKIRHVAVKEAVFPFAKLPGVDPVLGPEMKSTGEVMGIDFDFGKAYYKAQVAAGNTLPKKGRVFISVRKEDRAKIRSIAEKLYELGFEILATNGTLEAIEKAGVRARLVRKVSEGSPNILDMMLKREIDLIINTPTAGKIPYTDGFYIRRYAVDLGIPYITTITAAEAAVKAMDSIRKGGITIRSLDDYHKGKSPIRRLEEFC
ncbi:MAG: carbamoyl-phosphate synthase large subunit [Candidatus Hydrothermarchaeota archaeon]|nr:MAG: carbamoyl-phosphate synthase large subunit [Candidatus Hydrothermarchaeota archaeon]